MASPLADAHLTAQARLRRIAGVTVANIWRNLPAYDRENVDEWLSRVLPVVLTAQRTSVSLTEAYVARARDKQPRGLSAEEIIRRLRGKTTPEEVYHRPFVKVWTALGKQTPWEEAVAAGLAQATGSAAMDVQMASRGTYAGVERSDRAIQRWRRVADGDACDYCSMIDGAITLSADAMPLHNHCGCGLEPVEDELDPTPLPDGVAVNEHGELGPVLGSPDENFTSAAEIPAL